MKVALVFTLISFSLSAQDAYLTGHLSAYAYGYKYQGDFPFDHYKYSEYSISTNRYIGAGYSFDQKHIVEFGVSLVGYRYHYPNSKGLVVTTPPGCNCVTGPGYSAFPRDYANAVNLNFTYKYGLLNPRHLNERRRFQIFVMGGGILQINPPKDPYIFKLASDQLVGNNGYLTTLTYDRSENLNFLINVGAEVEHRIFVNGLYVKAGFNEQMGLSKQMITHSSYQQKGVTHEGERISYGSGRSLSFGLRYYIPKEILLKKALDTVRYRNGYVYVGIDFGKYRNKQTHTNAYPYTDKVIRKEDENLNGINVGFRKKRIAYETGFYLMLNNMGYTVEEGPFFNSINYTSDPYLYIPLRFKFAALSITSSKKVLELLPSFGLGSSIHLPENIRSTKVQYHSPEENFSEKSFAVSWEAGLELVWHFGRFSFTGYTRYLKGFGNLREVEFNSVVAGSLVTGKVESETTGHWNGFSARFRVNK